MAEAKSGAVVSSGTQAKADNGREIESVNEILSGGIPDGREKYDPAAIAA
jgi:hypothetical protein